MFIFQPVNLIVPGQGRTSVAVEIPVCLVLPQGSELGSETVKMCNMSKMVSLNLPSQNCTSLSLSDTAQCSFTYNS